MLSGIEAINAGADLEFYSSSTDVFTGMDAIQQSMASDATGVNYLLATGSLTYYEDGVLSTSSAFYAAWDNLYDAWVLVKQAYLYASIEAVLKAEADGTFGNRKYAVIGGGAVMHKIDGLWVGNIGVYGSSAALPATTYLGVGCSASVGSAASGFVTYTVKGSTTRTWVSAYDRVDISSVIGANLFVVAEQTADVILADGFYDTYGTFVSNVSYYTSKAYTVTPGELILARTSPENIGVQITYFTSGSAWLLTTSQAASTHSSGYIVVPANAAYVRICVNKYLQTDTALYRVSSGAVASKVRTHYTKLCAIGDSISACVALNTEDQWFRIAGIQNGITEFVNLAVSGHRTADIVANQLTSIPTDADVIQLLTGIPDAILATVALGTKADDQWFPTTYGYLDAIANYLIKNHTTAKIIWCTPTRYPGDTNLNKYGHALSDYADAVAIVAKRYGFTLVDFYGGVGALFGIPAGADLYLYDNLHQNAAGSALMAEFYSKFLRPGASGTPVSSAVVDYLPTALPSIKAALGTGGNKFVISEQTGANIIDNVFIDLNGVAQSTTDFFVSSLIAVTPGTRISVGVSPSTSAPLAYYDASLNWLHTVQYSDARTDGHLTVPAGAAYARLNVERAYMTRMALYFVYPTVDTHFNKRVPRTLTAIGDSIILGTGTDADNIWWKLAGAQAGYTTLLNHGVGGSTLAWVNTNSVVYRIWNNQIPAGVSDTIIVNGGINDHSNGSALGLKTDTGDAFATSFYGALHFTAQLLKAQNPYAKIIWCTPTRYYGDTDVNSDGRTLADYAEAIVYVARFYGFSVVDLYNDVGLDMSSSPYRSLFTSDNVHHNIAGSRLLANVIAPYLEHGGVTYSPGAYSYGSTGAVSSVFGRTGAVTATSGDYNTSQVTENTNLYYTDARVLAAVLTGLSTASSTDVTATDNVLAAIGKLQAQCDLAARTDTTNTFTEQQTFSAAPVFSSAFAAPAHGTASTPQVVNVCYGTSATAPSGVPEGTLYFQYT